MKSQTDRQRQLNAMFEKIAGGYDRINVALSMGLDRVWRRQAVSLCRVTAGAAALDVAVGTGDFAVELLRQGAGTVVGVDPSQPMMQEGRKKLAAHGLEDRVTLVSGLAEQLPVATDAFDCATMGFGLRNVSDVEQAFREMARAVRPGGRVVALEIARPRNPVLRFLFSIYFYYLGPYLATLLGGDVEAYRYLPRSAREFMSREEVCARMTRAGLQDAYFRDLSFGLVCLYVGTSPG